MTPHREKKRKDGKVVAVGTLVLDRVFRGVGRIRIASGQSDTVDGRRRFGKMDRMLTELYQDGKHDYLVRLRDRQLAPLQLFAAFQSGRLDRLPTADLMLPLAVTFAKWAASSPTGKLNKGFRVAVGKLLATIAPAATVGDFPEVVQKRQAVCMAAETPAAFNHFKKHAQRFVALTLGKDHPLYVKLARIERLKVVSKRKRGLTRTEALAVWAFLPEPARLAFRELCLTGMRPDEYFGGNWQVLQDRIEVYGTKTAGSDRVIPLVEPIVGLTMGRGKLRYALNKWPDMELEPYTARRTFMGFMEEAGIPRARRRMYLGHGNKDVSDLYERSHLTAYLQEDAVKLRAFIGVQGVRLMKGATK